ncbi:TetR family transcriptional regulator [Actinoplanes ianthinogenes]|uniref:TetR family transcriptional regulator n=1 Tax=Actinoplanes ianthinogenes TaxID=122358 RepID=A0ABM7LQ27_9ACTN|nr:TetR family transcriptional regulator [Actinoplanes ianthinogenes]
MDAAIAAGAERGLRSLSLTDVAAKAGLTRGAVLYYYADLEALLVEVHKAGVARLCDGRDAELATLADARQMLVAAIRAGLPTGPDDALMRLLYEFDVLAGASPLHDDLVRAMYERQHATYLRILRLGEQQGHFRIKADAEQVAMNLVALEDAYGLHIVGGNILIGTEQAEAAIVSVAEHLTHCTLG